jgi:prevent-host-death family protein
LAVISVTLTEFRAKFGKCREAAMREPVSITAHGRDSLVLLSAEEYKRLKRRDRQAFLLSELPDDELRNMLEGDWSAKGREFDHELEGSRDE